MRMRTECNNTRNLRTGGKGRLQMVEGTIGFFHDRKGYGFIERNDDDDAEDVFFHMEDVGGPDLEEGEEVRFDVEEADKGPRAKNVERL